MQPHAKHINRSHPGDDESMGNKSGVGKITDFQEKTQLANHYKLGKEDSGTVAPWDSRLVLDPVALWDAELRF